MRDNLQYRIGLGACSLALLVIGSGIASAGEAGCLKPDITDEIPSVLDTVVRISEVRFSLSANADPRKTVVQIGDQEAEVTTAKGTDGRWAVSAVIAPAVTEEGRVRIAILAKTREGCEKRLVYFVPIDLPEP